MIVTKANKLFREGRLCEAEQAYREVIERYQEDPLFPKTLLSYCLQQRDYLYQIISAEQKKKNGTPARDIQCIHLGKSNNSQLPITSIVIPHYESLEFLIEGLESIQAQSAKNIEVIIVDDASPSFSEVKSKLEKSNFSFPITLVRMTSNKGPSCARNVGVELSKGRFVCFLDADDYFDNETLEKRQIELNGWAYKSATYSSMSYVNESGQSLNNKILKNQGPISWHSFTSNKFPCSAVLIKRKFLEADRFNEDLVSGEDYEFFSRLAQRGVIYEECEGTIFYRQHKNSLTHKDMVGDVRDRTKVSDFVYSRSLNWSLYNSVTGLPSALKAHEIARRIFPIACVLALQGKVEDAIRLQRELDIDVVFSLPVRALADSIQFFLSRELIADKNEIDKIFTKEACHFLCEFLASSIRFRHIRRTVILVRRLFKSQELQSIALNLLESLVEPKIQEINFLEHKSVPKHADLFALKLSHENYSSETLNAAVSHFKKHQHLEGVFPYKVINDGKTEKILLNSIAPSFADSTKILDLGTTLFPGVMLDRDSFTIVSSTLSCDSEDENEIYLAFLRSIKKLRIKVVGGVPKLRMFVNKMQEVF